ncbi:hypothetical protein Angca_000281, partial [Angiostrongylus cantonensis]
IHSQNLSELQTFNHLLSSLNGKPLKSIKKFQPNKQNYIKAIEFLSNKYGDSEELIRQLLQELDQTSFRSPTMHERHMLLEDIQVTISQLTQKAEN